MRMPAPQVSGTIKCAIANKVDAGRMFTVLSHAEIHSFTMFSNAVRVPYYLKL
jgi:hypothetical protein